MDNLYEERLNRSFGKSLLDRPSTFSRFTEAPDSSSTWFYSKNKAKIYSETAETADTKKPSKNKAKNFSNTKETAETRTSLTKRNSKRKG